MKLLNIFKKPNAEKEKEFRENLAREKIDNKDRLAMMLAAFVTVLLPCVLILTTISLFAMWVFGAV